MFHLSLMHQPHRSGQLRKDTSGIEIFALEMLIVNEWMLFVDGVAFGQLSMPEILLLDLLTCGYRSANGYVSEKCHLFDCLRHLTALPPCVSDNQWIQIPKMISLQCPHWCFHHFHRDSAQILYKFRTKRIRLKLIIKNTCTHSEKKEQQWTYERGYNK